MASVSTQLGNRQQAEGDTPFCTSLASIFSEIVETRAKPDISLFSPLWIAHRRPAECSSPSSKPASASKSCTCSQLRAPENREVSQAAGSEKSVGSTTRTTSGRQTQWLSITGKLASAKLARCRMRFVAEGCDGTHSGQRNTRKCPEASAEFGCKCSAR